MTVGGRYEVGELVAEAQESRTFAAQDNVSGQAVLVHQLLDPPPGSLKPSLRVLAGRCTAGRGGVIQRLESEGAEYLVTEVREDFRDLRAALERIALLPPPAPAGAGEERFTRVGAWRVPSSFSTPPASPAPADPSVSRILGSPAAPAAPEAWQSPGDFTRSFMPAAPAPTETRAESVASGQPSVTGAEPVTPEPPALTSEPPPLAPEPHAAAPADPGEFTRMMQAPAAAQPSQPAVPPAADQPGEFTRMFRASQAPPRAESVSPASAPGAGEFTRLFKAPEPSHPAPREAPAAKSEPGDFTRYFQSPLGSGSVRETAAPPQFQPPAAPPTPAAPQPGEYTRLFQTPAPPVAPPTPESGATRAFATPTALPSQPPLPEEQVPSDFTRIIQARPAEMAQPASPQPVTAPAAEPPPRKQGPPLGLVILFASLAVLAITLVLFFALRR
ncbi:MAG: hypothetical protein IT159_02545 [Bryobacterales bacterium]|nr:hypothetical protein [Bryobacterales bacterium]